MGERIDCRGPREAQDGERKDREGPFGHRIGKITPSGPKTYHLIRWQATMQCSRENNRGGLASLVLRSSDFRQTIRPKETPRFNPPRRSATRRSSAIRKRCVKSIADLGSCKPDSDPSVLEAEEITMPENKVASRKKGKKRSRAWEDDDDADFGSKGKKGRHQ